MTLSDHQYHLLHNNNETASDAVEDDLDDSTVGFSSGPLLLDDADATEKDHAMAGNNENHHYNFTSQFFLSTSYQNYVTSRQSADPYVYLATLGFCIVTTILLCCMVAWKRGRQNKIRKKKQEETTTMVTTTAIPTGSPKKSGRRSMDRLVVSPTKTVSSSDSSSSPPSTPRQRREASAVEEEEEEDVAEGFEAVLKTPTRWSRHRTHARWRHTMQRLEVVYQNNQVAIATSADSGNTDESDSDDNDHEIESLSSHSEATNTGQSGAKESSITSSSSSNWDSFLQVIHYDTDMKRLLHLACPFVAQALVQGSVEVLTAGLIGKRLGTRPLAAYVLVKLCIQVTYQMTTGAMHESLTTLCCSVSSSRAWAWAPLSHRRKLVADYFQLSVLLGILGSLALGGVWYFSMDIVLAWFGMDQETIDMGTSYAIVLLLDYGFSSVNESIHALLNIIQLEGHSAILIATEQIISFVAILLVTSYTNPTLQTIGMVHFLVGVTFLILNLTIIWWNGWLVPYLESMTGCLAPRVSCSSSY